MKKQNDIGLLLLRITIAGLMLFHGIAKIINLNGIKSMLTKAGLPEFMAYGVYFTEIVAPILILIGLRTRLASLTLFFGMMSAMILANSDNIFAISKTGGLQIELILLFAFGALVLFFTGSGKYALYATSKWD